MRIRRVVDAALRRRRMRKGSRPPTLTAPSAASSPRRSPAAASAPIRRPPRPTIPRTASSRAPSRRATSPKPRPTLTMLLAVLSRQSTRQVLKRATSTQSTQLLALKRGQPSARSARTAPSPIRPSPTPTVAPRKRSSTAS